VITALVIGLVAAIASVPAGATSAPIVTARRRETTPPSTPAGYQAVPDSRNASFGVGDMTAAVQLPDGRRLFTFGDTGYDDIGADGRAGRFQGFGNNSAWVQSGRCFDLLDRAATGTRSWLIPPSNGIVYAQSAIRGNTRIAGATPLIAAC
jgi:hypothetical protein